MTLLDQFVIFLKKTFRKYQLLRFILAGGGNTLLGYGLYAALIFAGLPIAAASFISLCAGIVIGFLVQGNFVFGNMTKHAFLKFICVWLLIYLVHVSIVFLAKGLGFNPYIGGILAIPLVTALSYVLQRYFVFK